jgi:hypothetical protein
MKNFLSKYAGYKVSHSNSYVATAFAVVVTSLLAGGYEVTQTVNDGYVAATAAAQPEVLVRMETIVVTAKRG